MKDFFVGELQRLAAHCGWTLEAWCVLDNHYHFVAHALTPDAARLGMFLRHLHGVASRERNRRDGSVGEGWHWHNYWETQPTGQRGHLARLNYVHANAVHHRLVAEPAQWKWSSAAHFERAATPAWVRTIYGFPYGIIAKADGE